ncbi:MAG: carbohydrate-binding protein [Phaeodactylibacter sp.]|nr:carbohydrate-binding protein [Phaeodactylibacter sp.]MCB9048241.1 carbohydrate-binding protein [Lewinellaceae bacterium]
MKKILFLSALILLTFEGKSQEKSYKRGVSYGYHSENDMEAASQGISWWYNWAAQPDVAIRNTYPNYDVDFTPMAWNSAGISGVENWAGQDANVRYVLGFNEPNFRDQANMTPSQAAAAWPALQAIAQAHELEIVGPAVNYCGNCVSENGVTYSNPFTYLDAFFAACTNCQVDHIALHWYGGGNSIVGYVEEARQYGKPIWVTEFAAWDGSATNLKAQKNYLAGTVNFLERDPDVYRYSWFIGRTSGGPSAYPYIDLYGADGTLTELGQLYMDIPVYDPDQRFPIPGRIEAEEYHLMSGLFSELTEDNDGFMNIGWTESGDWAEYRINVQHGGTYKLRARVSGSNPGEIDFLVDGQPAATLSTPNTGGWQSWVTVSANIALDSGEHTLRMNILDGGFNINWIDFSEATVGSEDTGFHPAEIFPNPVTGGMVNVQLPETLPKSDWKIALYDVFGNCLLEKKLNLHEPRFQIDVSEARLIPGIYLLYLTRANQAISERIVIL